MGLAVALTAGTGWAALAANPITCTGGPCTGTDLRDEITGSDSADQIDAKRVDHVEGGERRRHDARRPRQ